MSDLSPICNSAKNPVFWVFDLMLETSFYIWYSVEKSSCPCHRCLLSYFDANGRSSSLLRRKPLRPQLGANRGHGGAVRCGCNNPTSPHLTSPHLTPGRAGGGRLVLICGTPPFERRSAIVYEPRHCGAPPPSLPPAINFVIFSAAEKRPLLPSLLTLLPGSSSSSLTQGMRLSLFEKLL